MYAVETNEPGLVIQSHPPGSSPGAGALVTPGNNTYGSYTTVIGAGASVQITDEAYELVININNVAVSASAKDCLVTIGIDYANGTSFVDWIVDLAGSCATSYSAGGGITYVFPIRVPAGVSLGAKASVNNATVGTVNVQVRLKCRPTRPELIRVGSFVRTFGSSPSTSSGTAVTPGANAESAYVQLGTVAAGEELWWWQLGLCLNNAAANSNSAFFDLGIGSASNKRNVIVDQGDGITAAESLSYGPVNGPGQAYGGDGVYVRAWGVATQSTGKSAIAYAVGG